MNTTPTATVPNKYRNDLTAGAHAARWHHDRPRVRALARHMVAVGVPMRRARVRRCEPSAARR